MTMQNSLERLFEGMAATLRAAAEHQGNDDYMSEQLAAAAELLDNIAPRVQWSDRTLLEVSQRARVVLECAVAVAPDGELLEARAVLEDPLPPPRDVRSLIAVRDRHLSALAEVADWVFPESGVSRPAAPTEALAEFVRWQLDEEREAVRQPLSGPRGPT
jgi:hypothetical protein